MRACVEKLDVLGCTKSCTSYNMKNTRYQVLGGSYAAIFDKFVPDTWFLSQAQVPQYI